MTTPQLNPLKDPRLYVLAWLSLNHVTVNERGELVEKLGRMNIDIFDTMWLDYKSQVRAHNSTQKNFSAANKDSITAVAEKDMMKALNELISKEKATFRKRSIEALKCENEDLSELKKFIKAITGEADPTHVGVIAHWAWMVKNKMAKKDVSYHIMPILFGKQGGGKTVALNKFIEPMQNYRLNIKMNQMTDDRYFFSMAENYVVVFDEMQGAARTDVDSLKNQITNDWNDARRLGTNDVYKIRQACSFIGATNKPVSEQIIDPTGMRRFWEIKTMDKLNWELLETIDFTALWKGIDENRKEGYLVEHLDTIREVQSEMTIQDDFDAFIEEFCLEVSPENHADTQYVEVNTVYQNYKSWAISGNQKIHNKIWFGKKMSNKGFTAKQKKINGKNKRVFFVSSSCSILTAANNLVKLQGVF